MVINGGDESNGKMRYIIRHTVVLPEVQAFNSSCDYASCVISVNHIYRHANFPSSRRGIRLHRFRTPDLVLGEGIEPHCRPKRRIH